MNGFKVTRNMGLGLAALALTAGSLAAQQPQPGAAPHPHRMAACPMPPGAGNQDGNGMSGTAMMSMLPGPAMMMSERSQLGLNNTQMQRLDSLATVQQQSLQRVMPRIRQGVTNLVNATKGDIDVNAAVSAHQQISEAHSSMLATNLESIKAARQVLTPEQRSRWDTMVAERGGVMGMMMCAMGSMMHGAHGGAGMPR